MAILVDMAELSYDNQISTRSTPKVVQALDMLLAQLRGSGRVRFRSRRLSKEALVNAMCLMLADLDVAQVEALLAPHVARLEAILAESGVIRLETTREPVRNPAPKNRRKPGSE
jgi:hypothetical protein